MTELEKLQAQLKANNDKMQNDFIDKIVADIEWLCEKSNRKDYEPTEHEREQLAKIITIVNNMNQWF